MWMPPFDGWKRPIESVSFIFGDLTFTRSFGVHFNANKNVSNHTIHDTKWFAFAFFFFYLHICIYKWLIYTFTFISLLRSLWLFDYIHLTNQIFQPEFIDYGSWEMEERKKSAKHDTQCMQIPFGLFIFNKMWHGTYVQKRKKNKFHVDTSYSIFGTYVRLVYTSRCLYTIRRKSMPPAKDKRVSCEEWRQFIFSIFSIH